MTKDFFNIRKQLQSTNVQRSMFNAQYYNTHSIV